MFEKQLTALIAAHLNRFLKDVTKEQLQVSLWNGQVVLENLELRSDVIDQLSLLLWKGSGGRDVDISASPHVASLLMPFTIVKGVVKQLTITVPWTTLNSDPVSFEIDGIDLVLAPLRRRQYNADEEATREEAVKTTRLLAFEASRVQRGEPHQCSASLVKHQLPGSDTTSTVTPNPGFNSSYSDSVPGMMSSIFGSLVTKVLQNLHVVAKNITAVFQFDYAGLHSSLAFELCASISEIVLFSTDEDWRPRFVSSQNVPHCRFIQITGLRVECRQIKEVTEEGKSGWINTHTLLEPTNVTIRLRDPPVLSEETGTDDINESLNGTVSTTTAYTSQNIKSIHITISPAIVRVSPSSLKSIAACIDSITNAIQYAPFRPYLYLLDSIEGTDDTKSISWRVQARGRWHFAIKCIMIARLRARRDLKAVLKFMKIKPYYLSLFKRSQDVPWLPPLSSCDISYLKELEKQLDFDQIVVLRSLGYAELCEEEKSVRDANKMIDYAKERKHSSLSQTWWGWGNPAQNGDTSTHISDKGSAEITVDYSSVKVRRRVGEGLIRRLRQYDEYRDMRNQPLPEKQPQKLESSGNEPVRNDEYSKYLISVDSESVKLEVEGSSKINCVEVGLDQICYSFTTTRFVVKRSDDEYVAAATAEVVITPSNEHSVQVEVGGITIAMSKEGTNIPLMVSDRASQSSWLVLGTNHSFTKVELSMGPTMLEFPQPSYCQMLVSIIEDFQGMTAARANPILSYGDIEPGKDVTSTCTQMDRHIHVTLRGLTVHIYDSYVDITNRVELVNLQLAQLTLDICILDGLCTLTGQIRSSDDGVAIHGFRATGIIDAQSFPIVEVTVMTLRAEDDCLRTSYGSVSLHIHRAFIPRIMGLATTYLPIISYFKRSLCETTQVSPEVRQSQLPCGYFKHSFHYLSVYTYHSINSSAILLSINRTDTMTDALTISMTEGQHTSISVELGTISIFVEGSSESETTIRSALIEVPLTSKSPYVIIVETPCVRIGRPLASFIETVVGTAGTISQSLRGGMNRSDYSSTTEDFLVQGTKPKWMAFSLKVKDNLTVLLNGDPVNGKIAVLASLVLSDISLISTSALDATCALSISFCISSLRGFPVACVSSPVLPQEISHSLEMIHKSLPVNILVSEHRSPEMGTSIDVSVNVAEICLYYGLISEILCSINSGAFKDVSSSLELRYFDESGAAQRMEMLNSTGPQESDRPPVINISISSLVIMGAQNGQKPVFLENPNSYFRISVEQIEVGIINQKTTVSIENIRLGRMFSNCIDSIYVTVYMDYSPPIYCMGVDDNKDLHDPFSTELMTKPTATHIAVLFPKRASIIFDEEDYVAVLALLGANIMDPRIAMSSDPVFQSSLGLTMREGIEFGIKSKGGVHYITVGSLDIIRVSGGDDFRNANELRMRVGAVTVIDDTQMVLPRSDLVRNHPLQVMNAISPSVSSSTDRAPRLFQLIEIPEISLEMLSKKSYQGPTFSIITLCCRKVHVTPVCRLILALRDTLIPEVGMKSLSAIVASRETPQSTCDSTLKTLSLSVSIDEVFLAAREAWLEPIADISLKGLSITMTSWVSGGSEISITAACPCVAKARLCSEGLREYIVPPADTASICITIVFPAPASERPTESTTVKTVLQTTDVDIAITGLLLVINPPLLRRFIDVILSEMLPLSRIMNRDASLMERDNIPVTEINRINILLLETQISIPRRSQKYHDREAGQTLWLINVPRVSVSNSPLMGTPHPLPPHIISQYRNKNVRSSPVMFDSFRYFYDVYDISLSGNIHVLPDVIHLNGPLPQVEPTAVTIQIRNPILYSAHLCCQGEESYITHSHTYLTFSEDIPPPKESGLEPLTFVLDIFVTFHYLKTNITPSLLTLLLDTSTIVEGATSLPYHVSTTESVLMNFQIDVKNPRIVVPNNGGEPILTARVGTSALISIPPSGKVRVAVGGPVSVNGARDRSLVSSTDDKLQGDSDNPLFLPHFQLEMQGGIMMVKLDQLKVLVDGNHIHTILKFAQQLEILSQHASEHIAMLVAQDKSVKVGEPKEEPGKAINLEMLNIQIGVADIAAMMLKESYVRISKGKAEGDTATTPTSMMVNATCNNFYLLDCRPGRHSKCDNPNKSTPKALLKTELPIVVISEVKISHSMGDIHIHVDNATVNNDSIFFADLSMSLLDAHEYLYSRVQLPKSKEESFQSKISLTFDHITIRTFRSLFSTSIERPTLELCFPGLVIKHTKSTQATSMSIEAVDGSLRYHGPSQLSTYSLGKKPCGGSFYFNENCLSLKPLCSGIEFVATMTSGVLMDGDNVKISIGKANMSLPLGEALQNTVAIVAESVAPFFSILHILPKSPEINNAQEKKMNPSRSLTVAVDAPYLGAQLYEIQEGREGPVAVVILGIDISGFSYRQCLWEVIETLEVKVGSILSTTDLGLQPRFIVFEQREVPEDRDRTTKFALFFRKEASMSLNGSEDNTVLRFGTGCVTLSPQLIHLLDMNLLRPAALGIRDASDFNSKSRSKYTINSSRLKQSPSAEGFSLSNTVRNGVTMLSHDFNFAPGKGSITIGGSRGDILHLVKLPNSPNVIHLTGGTKNHKEDGPFVIVLNKSVHFPIVVDSGISVYCSGLIFVLEDTHDTLQDYIHLGERSFFNVDPNCIKFRDATDNNRSSLVKMDASRRHTVSLDVRGEFSMKLCNGSQSLGASTNVVVKYNLVTEGETREIVLEETGTVSFPSFTVLCNDGAVSRKPITIITNIRYDPPGDYNEIGAKTEGVSTINVIIDEVRLRVTGTHTKLLYDTVAVLLPVFDKLSVLDEELDEIVLKREPDTSQLFGTVSELDNASFQSSRNSHSKKPAVRNGVINAKLNRKCSSAVPRISVVFNSPLIEVELLNDTSQRLLGILGIYSSIAQLHGLRDGSVIAFSGSTMITACDYPHGSEEIRRILDVSPEIAIQYDNVLNVGSSIEMAIAASSFYATVPIQPILSLLTYRYIEPPRGNILISNLTGVNLVLDQVPDPTSVSHVMPDSLPTLALNADVSRIVDPDFHRGTALHVSLASQRLLSPDIEDIVPCEVCFSSTNTSPPAFLRGVEVTGNQLHTEYCTETKNIRLTTGVFVENLIGNGIDDPIFYMKFENNEGPMPTKIYLRVSSDGEKTPVPYCALQHKLQFVTDFDKTVQTNRKIDNIGDGCLELPVLETLVGIVRSSALSSGEFFLKNHFETASNGCRSCVIIRISRVVSKISTTPETCAVHISLYPVAFFLNTLKIPLHVGLYCLCTGDNKDGKDRELSSVMITAGGRRNFFDWDLSDLAMQIEIEVPSGYLKMPEGNIRQHAVIDMEADQLVEFEDERQRRCFFKLRHKALLKSSTGVNFSKRLWLEPRGFIMNNSPIPLKVIGGDGLAHAGQCDTGIGASECLPLSLSNSTSSIRIQTNTSSPSASFHLDSAMTSTLSCKDDSSDLAHIFSIYRRIDSVVSLLTNDIPEAAASIPFLDVGPMWYVCNDSSQHTLHILRPHISSKRSNLPPLILQPNESMGLHSFDKRCASDPLISIMFDKWSPTAPIPLSSLCHKSAATKFQFLTVYESVEEQDGVSVQIGDKIEIVGCVVIEVDRRKSHRITLSVSLQLDASSFPIIVENRTPNHVHVKQVGGVRRLTVNTLQQSHFACDVFTPQSSASLEFMIIHPLSKRVYKQVVTLAQLPSPSEGIVVADKALFLTASICGESIIFAITTDRLLHSTFLFSPKCVFNIALFLKSVSLHVCALTPAKPGHYFYNRALKGDFGQYGQENPEDVLQNREMDIIALTIERCSTTLISNGQYKVLSFSIGALELNDVTSPFSLFPTLVRCQKPDGSENIDAISISMHEKGENKGSANANCRHIIALNVDVCPLEIKLHDKILFIFKGVISEIIPALNRNPTLDTAAAGKIAKGKYTGDTSIRFDKVRFSQIPLIITLSRRNDGMYNPFEGIPLHRVFIQSIDKAYIVLPEITAADITHKLSRRVRTTKYVEGDADQVQVESLAYLFAVQVVFPSYKSSVIMQAYKVVGSFECLGNPILFSSTLTGGVRDFVVSTVALHPIKGLSSLLSSTTSCTLHSCSLLSKVSGRMLGVLALDSHWLSSYDDLDGPEATQSSAFLRGIKEGVSGIVTGPYQGAVTSGVTGLISGIVTGATGAIAKPMSGALLSMASATELLSATMQHSRMDKPLLTDMFTSLPQMCRNRPYVSLQMSVGMSSTSSLENEDLPCIGTAQRCLAEVIEEGNGRGDDDDSVRRVHSLSPLVKPVKFMDRKDFLNRCKAFNVLNIVLGTAEYKSDTHQLRRLCSDVGAHNFAIHATWEVFIDISTPEEFVLWGHTALYSRIATLFNERNSGKQFTQPRSNGITSKSTESALVSASVSYREKEKSPFDRAQHLKHSLGIAQMLKYVTLEQFVKCVTWGESITYISPKEFKQRVAPLLAKEIESKTLCCASWI